MGARSQIYVDLDDVLAETGRTFLQLLESEFGRRVEWDQVHDYDLGVSLGMASKVAVAARDSSVAWAAV